MRRQPAARSLGWAWEDRAGCRNCGDLVGAHGARAHAWLCEADGHDRAQDRPVDADEDLRADLRAAQRRLSAQRDLTDKIRAEYEGALAAPVPAAPGRSAARGRAAAACAAAGAGAGAVLAGAGPDQSLAAAALGLVAAVLADAARSRARAAAAVRAARDSRRSLLGARAAAVLAAWATHELDLADVFARPALTDVRQEPTAAFHRARSAHEDAAALLSRAAGAAADAALTAYEGAVRDLEAAWRAADDHATRTGLRHLPVRERERVEKAIKALATALDGGAPEAERQEAYRAAVRLVEGVVVVPRQALAPVAAKVRLELPR